MLREPAVDVTGACAIRVDGTLACEATSAVPEEVRDQAYSKLDDHHGGLRVDGTAVGWVTGAVVEFDGPFVDISFTWTSICGRTDGGDVRCSGDLAGLEPGGSAASLECSGPACCVIRDEGPAACFGDETFVATLERHVPADAREIWLAERGESGCAAGPDGDAGCWGAFEQGVVLPTSIGRAIDVTVTEDEVCAVIDDGSVKCWTDLNGEPPVFSTSKALSLSAYNKRYCIGDADGEITCTAPLNEGEWTGE